MTALLKLLADGALAAAELLALTLVAPALAAQPADVVDRPVVLHRLTTAPGTRLLGALDGARVVQDVRDDGPTDRARLRSTAEHGGDAVRIDAVAMECDEAWGHAALTTDEAIADATMRAVGADALVQQVAARTLAPARTSARVAPAAAGDQAASRALLVRQGDVRFVIVVPRIDAHAATLVLRPAGSPAEQFELGSVASGRAVAVPIAGRVRFDALAAGAIELTLTGQRETVWTTLIGEVIDSAGPVQAQVGD